MSADWLNGLLVGLAFSMPIGVLISRLIDAFEHHGRHDRWV